MITTLNLAALAALVPALLISPEAERRDARFWGTLALAIAGPLIALILVFDGHWQTGFAAALWLGVVASLLLFALIVGNSPVAARLTPLVIAHALAIGTLATAFAGTESRAYAPAAPGVWLATHIALSIVTYGVVTLAALAGLAVFLQERALKRRQPTRLTRLLPPVLAGETLQFRLLQTAAALLTVGLVSGIAVEVVSTGRWLRVDHKTVLVMAALAAVIGVLVAHARIGLRGRRFGRMVLVAYLLLTLAYPGVKFVTDVVLARG
ncbi:MAG: hypothetical protein EAZ99_00900 [Alphaproteobacteria bacterium]|nr:cytochrome c biogenesis protein CcsA [Alphaproteobacteria bacterium]TAD91919.1 MAG: hypothetical protein EAZ99_00900 [Alphaproteobacteria bacterium]